MEDIRADSQLIGRIEAARMAKIAQLYGCEDLRPDAVPVTAQERADRAGSRIRALQREDTTVAELSACLFLSEFEARRLVGTALALTCTRSLRTACWGWDAAGLGCSRITLS